MQDEYRKEFTELYVQTLKATAITKFCEPVAHPRYGGHRFIDQRIPFLKWCRWRWLVLKARQTGFRAPEEDIPDFVPYWVLCRGISISNQNTRRSMIRHHYDTYGNTHMESLNERVDRLLERAGTEFCNLVDKLDILDVLFGCLQSSIVCKK
jgi:hypothetical protein